MRILKKHIKENKAFAATCFIACNATLLYILFFIIKNFNLIFSSITHALGNFLTALSPLFIGVIISYIISPLVNIIDEKFMTKLESKIPDKLIKSGKNLTDLEKNSSVRKLISILLTLLLIFAAITAVIYGFAVLIVGNFFVGNFNDIFNSIKSYILTFDVTRMAWTNNIPDGILGDKINAMLESTNNWLEKHLTATQLINTITGISGSIMNFFIGIVISVYLLKDKIFFYRIWRKFLHLTTNQKTHALINESLSAINDVVMKFIKGAMIDSTIVAILASIGLSILGLDFAVFIGCFAGICNIIPYFGSILGMVPAFLIGTFTDDISTGIIAVIILFVVQQIDCNFIYPKVIGSSTGLHPLFVLLAVTISGYYGGILGMVLAVPLAGILKIFIIKGIDRLCNIQETSEDESIAEQ